MPGKLTRTSLCVFFISCNWQRCFKQRQGLHHGRPSINKKKTNLGISCTGSISSEQTSSNYKISKNNTSKRKCNIWISIINTCYGIQSSAKQCQGGTNVNSVKYLLHSSSCGEIRRNTPNTLCITATS